MSLWAAVPPSAFENFGKVGQILARFKIFWVNLGKVYDIFVVMYWIFWAIILIFLGKKGQPPMRKWPGTPMNLQFFIASF